MKTTIISFSSRHDGNCAQVGKLIQSMNSESVLYDFSEFEIHACGRCNYECFKEREACVYIDDMECRLLETITQSDVAYFILPNYCDYPCANYFIFNERSQCYFQGRPEMLDAYLRVPKRCIVLSNTNEDNFIKALAYQTENNPDILFLSAKKYGKKSINGDLLTVEKAIEDITKFVKQQRLAGKNIV